MRFQNVYDCIVAWTKECYLGGRPQESDFRIVKKLAELRIIFFILITFSVTAQTDLTSIKKAIPVKGVKNLVKVGFSSRLFTYYSKGDTGVWDNESKSILFHHIKALKRTNYQPNWISYSVPGEHGIFDMRTGTIMLRSSKPFIMAMVIDSAFVSVFGPSVIGLLDQKRNVAYYVPATFAKDTTFYDAGYSHDKCWYDAKSKWINYGYGNNDDKYFLDVTQIGPFRNYIKVSNDWNGMLLDPKTGKQVFYFEGKAREWKDRVMIVKPEVDHNSQFSFFDANLKPIFQSIPKKGFYPGHFQTLFNKNVRYAYHVDEGVYLLDMGKRKQFFSVYNMEPLGAPHREVFKIGDDFLHGGISYFTVSPDWKFGFFNSYFGELLKPQYTIVEKLAAPDGTYWYRGDSELQVARRYWSDTLIFQSWSQEWSKASIILNHISKKNNKVIASPAQTTADVHDASYYTSTEYRDGAGVLNLDDSTWTIKPDLHSILPHQDHYVALDITSNYYNAGSMQMLLYDEDFRPIASKKFKLSYIFNDMLIVMGEPYPTLYEYDIKQNKIKRTLGTAERGAADLRLAHGYLLLVDNNYSRDRQLKGADIIDIISPTGQLIKVPNVRCRFMDILPDDLLIIARIPNSEPRDRHIEDLKTDAYAIFDVRANKIITPWVDQITQISDSNLIYYRKNSTDEVTEIAIKDIRQAFK